MTTKNEMIEIDLSQYGLEESKAMEVKKDFDAVLKIAVELEDEYNKIIVKTIDEDLCNDAKALRLKYVKVRRAIASVHKERKAFYLSGGRAVDGLKNAYTHSISGNEEKLADIETHFERIEYERKLKVETDRTAKIEALGETAPAMIGEMSEEVFDMYFAGIQQRVKAISDAEAKAEKEALERAEKERKEKEEADRIEAEERKKIAEENALLKKEKEAREKKEAEEKAERDRIERKEKMKAKAESDRIEAERKAERDEANAKLEAERKEHQQLQADLNARAEKGAKDAAEQAKREKNQAHRKRVNRGALEALMSITGLDEVQAKAVVTDIAKGNIPNVSILY